MDSADLGRSWEDIKAADPDVQTPEYQAAYEAARQEQVADYERVRDALQACWDEYHELMPDALYEQVKTALGIKVFTATPLGLIKNPRDLLSAEQKANLDRDLAEMSRQRRQAEAASRDIPLS